MVTAARARFVSAFAAALIVVYASREARIAVARFAPHTTKNFFGRNGFEGLKMPQYEVGKLEQQNPIDCRHSTPSRIARDERRSPWGA